MIDPSKPVIAVDVHPDGRVTVEAEGYEGDSCVSAVEDLFSNVTGSEILENTQQNSGKVREHDQSVTG